jgi:hypothetical protein
MSGPPHLRLPAQLRTGRRIRAAEEASYPDVSEALDDAVAVVAGDVAASYPGLVAEVCADLDGSSRANRPTVRVYPRLAEPVDEPPAVEDERIRPLYARVLRLRHVDPGGLLCFVFFEGTVALGLLLALAELVNWWAVLVLPATVAVMVKVNDLVAGGVVRSAARVPDLEQERFRREMLPAVGRARVPDEWKISPVGRVRPEPGTTPVEPDAGDRRDSAQALPAAARLVLGRPAAGRIRANSGQGGIRRTPIGRPSNAHPAAERTEQWPGQQAGKWPEKPDTPQQRARQAGSPHYE